MIKEPNIKPCNMCKGKGLVKIGPQVRGLKRCPLCHGTGKK